MTAPTFPHDFIDLSYLHFVLPDEQTDFEIQMQEVAKLDGRRGVSTQDAKLWLWNQRSSRLVGSSLYLSFWAEKQIAEWQHQLVRDRLPNFTNEIGTWDKSFRDEMANVLRHTPMAGLPDLIDDLNELATTDVYKRSDMTVRATYLITYAQVYDSLYVNESLNEEVGLPLRKGFDADAKALLDALKTGKVRIEPKERGRLPLDVVASFVSGVEMTTGERLGILFVDTQTYNPKVMFHECLHAMDWLNGRRFAMAQKETAHLVTDVYLQYGAQPFPDSPPSSKRESMFNEQELEIIRRNMGSHGEHRVQYAYHSLDEHLFQGKLAIEDEMEDFTQAYLNRDLDAAKTARSAFMKAYSRQAVGVHINDRISRPFNSAVANLKSKRGQSLDWHVSAVNNMYNQKARAYNENRTLQLYVEAQIYDLISFALASGDPAQIDQYVQDAIIPALEKVMFVPEFAAD